MDCISSLISYIISNTMIWVVQMLLNVPASTVPHSHLVFHRMKHTRAELFRSASIPCLSSLTLFACSAALEPWWMHRQPLFIDDQNKTLRLTVCSKMDSFATCRYIWGYTGNPSDGAQAWDSVADLPQVVNSSVPGVCICVCVGVCVYIRGLNIQQKLNIFVYKWRIWPSSTVFHCTNNNKWHPN